MLDFNTIGIKTPEDLQEALQVEMTPQAFKDQFYNMVDRWGLDSSLGMLADALFGNSEIKGIVEPTHRIVDNFKNSGDPWDYHLEEIKNEQSKQGTDNPR